MLTGIYFYILALLVIFVFLAYKVYIKRKQERQQYEEREDNVFYDAIKKIRRD